MMMMMMWLVLGTDWDYFETHDVIASPYGLSESSLQVHFFDGTEDYTIILREDSQSTLLIDTSTAPSSSLSLSSSDPIGHAVDTPQTYGNPSPKDTRFF